MVFGRFFIYIWPFGAKIWDAEKRPFLHFMKEVNKLDIPQHVECDTPDCIHWKDGACAKESSVTIQEHHCVDYEERIALPAATVTIEVRDGVVQNVYASPDLPEVRVELLDFDNLKAETEEALKHGEQLLNLIEQSHNHIF